MTDRILELTESAIAFLKNRLTEVDEELAAPNNSTGTPGQAVQVIGNITES